MTTSTKLILSFALERETKGAARYYETDDMGSPLSIEAGAKIGTLYIRKTALGSFVPKSLLVTVEAKS